MTNNKKIIKILEKFTGKSGFKKGQIGYLYIEQALATQRQDIKKMIEGRREQPIYADFDEKPTDDPKKQVYCLTCGAFLIEGACVCAVTNATIDDIIKQL